MTVQTARGQGDGVAALVARLRAEQAAHQDKPAQALLLHECGVLEENHGEEPVAARDYLAAFNLDPQFREPLEALVRILSRRKSIKNLGKLLDALTRAASAPEERARAFWERAAFQQDYEKNLEGAKASLEEAVGANPEDATPWLELELVAAKQGDIALRMRAIEARAELASDPTWKAMLYVDLAELAAKGGDVGRAYELLDAASALEGSVRFRTRLLLERIATKENAEDVVARALEGQGDLIAEAIDDPAAGDTVGVPRYMRKAEYAADAWFRAAELHRKAGDLEGSAALLGRAAERLPESAVIARARLVAMEAAGESEAAAEIAKKELERGVGGAGAASLWLRIAEAAALRNDRAGALSALRGALNADPDCIPARALELDLLGDGQDPGALAASLELSAEAYKSEEAKGRAYLLAGYVWATGVGDVQAAKAALSQAASCGVPPGAVSRIARTLASLKGDAAWYEEATKRLLSAGSEPNEIASLWFELGRSRVLRGDEYGAGEAFAKLATCDAEGDAPGPSAWLGRVLHAYAIGISKKENAAESARMTMSGEAVPSTRLQDPIEELAKVETDPALSRGLSLVAALRRAKTGDRERALVRLRQLHETAAGDEVVAIFLAELERAAGNAGAAANALAACAAASEDQDLSASLHLEAGTLLWRAGDRARAIEEFEGARTGAPRAAALVLSWALCGADPDRVEGRRRAIEAAAESGADPTILAIERFGLEIVGSGDGPGDASEALAALERAESEATDDLATGAALARLVWPPGLEQRPQLERALDRLEECGAEAKAIANAERFRIAREVDHDRPLTSARAASWVASDPKLYTALEWLGAAIGAEDREAEIAAKRRAAVSLTGEARAAVEASAALVGLIDQPSAHHRFVGGEHATSALMNLELALPGCDPRRRSAALHGLGGALGTDTQIDSVALAAWNDLAGGAHEEALKSFRAVLEARPDDVASWEGVRASAEALGDHVSMALACAQLGSLCHDDDRGAEFWEYAGLTLLEHTDAHDDAEIAFERSFDRSPRRSVAFDKLFRRVRARNDDDKLLEIIARRLDSTEDEVEIGKLFWERARVLRKKGDRDGALAALENVTMLEPDHVGALALAGEIWITKGNFAQAAPLLGRLATIGEAPTQQRLMSGIAAVDLYENKLGDSQKALEILVGLHAAGLSTLPVRERLAKTAAKTGSWADATAILEKLMNERDKREGRIEAARLAMAIWRDKIRDPVKAEAAVAKLLEEVPDDGEALDLVLSTNYDAGFRTRVLGRAKTTLVQGLAAEPADAGRVALLAKIAGAAQDAGLRQATLGSLVALGRNDPGLSEELAKIDSRVAGRPQVVLDARAMAEIADPEDQGPFAELLAHMAECVSLALGPSLVSTGVTKKEKVEARGGHPLRVAVGEWMGAVGFQGEWDLYIGGPDPRAVTGIAGEVPALVIGSGVTLPFDAASRSAIAREVFGLRRGLTSVRTRDDHTIACVVVAACQEAGLQVPNPPFAVWGEVSRSIHKEISRKTKKAILEPCQRIASSGQDARAWADSARRSLDRMAVIAAGDVSLVLADVMRAPRDQLGDLVRENPRARRLLGFVLSPNYLELRKKLGMGVR